MDDDSELQAYANTVEATLCRWDYDHEGTLTDDSAIRVVEMLLDKYHFNRPDDEDAPPLLREGFDRVIRSMVEDLSDVPAETMVKILAVIHFVARRRTNGGREYFDVIRQYTGVRVGPGLRALPNPMA